MSTITQINERIKAQEAQEALDRDAIRSRIAELDILLDQLAAIRHEWNMLIGASGNAEGHRLFCIETERSTDEWDDILAEIEARFDELDMAYDETTEKVYALGLTVKDLVFAGYKIVIVRQSKNHEPAPSSGIVTLGEQLPNKPQRKPGRKPKIVQEDPEVTEWAARHEPK